VVLAGGAARRLGGVDKPMLRVAGSALLHRAVAALDGADPIVVVGPRRPGLAGVRWVREEPPNSGPVAALATGLAVLDTELVAVLAADLPGVSAATVARLRAGLGDAPGAVLIDSDGHRQWLIAVWRRRALCAALPVQPAGASLRAVLSGLPFAAVAARSREAEDIDTPGDLDRW
jgi:molybdopterin-guanine dinucleotide biosynthesis protein A